MYYYNTLKKERRMSAIERLVATVEGEILTNKKKVKQQQKGVKNESGVR